MSKYRYGVSFTILTVVESDEPMDYDDIVEAAALQKGIDPDDCNDIDVNTLDNTPAVDTPYGVGTVR